MEVNGKFQATAAFLRSSLRKQLLHTISALQVGCERKCPVRSLFTKTTELPRPFITPVQSVSTAHTGHVRNHEDRQAAFKKHRNNNTTQYRLELTVFLEKLTVAQLASSFVQKVQLSLSTHGGIWKEQRYNPTPSLPLH
jgi:hypothetical protein